MLRAKSIPEILVWNDHNVGDTEAEWSEFMNIYKRVYTPSLDDITLIDGTVVPGSAIALERARRTLLDSNDLPHVISLACATVGSDEVTSMDFFFDDMSAHSGQNLRIILETAVVPDEPLEPGPPPIFGKFYLWDPRTSPTGSNSPARTTPK